MTRKELSSAEIHDIKIDAIIEMLTLVISRFSGKEEAAEIAAVLARLKANRHDEAVLKAAFAYCSDGWISGPTD